MCRQKGNTYCSALGPDVTKWSRATPLPRPDSFKEGWEHFKEALYLEEQGDFDEARRILSTHPGLEEREWFDAHAQNAGEWRRKTLGKVVPISDSPMDPNKNFSKFLKSILERDNYRSYLRFFRRVASQVNDSMARGTKPKER